VAYGADSSIEVGSGAALVLRLRHDFDPSRCEGADRKTLCIVGTSFFVLALYVLYESSSALLLHDASENSILGIAVAATSLIAMPVLARAKGRVARERSDAC
jgi:hypothetical protein